MAARWAGGGLLAVVLLAGAGVTAPTPPEENLPGQPALLPAGSDAPAPPGPPAGSSQDASPPLSREDVRRLVGDFLREREEQARRAAADKPKATVPKPTIGWSAQIQTDGVWAVQDAANRAAVGPIPDGLVFRRARVNLFGDYGSWEYKLGVDYALAGRPSFIDVFIGYNGLPELGRVRVGHFFEPFGFEQFSQNRHLTFLERGLPARPFAPGRNPGVMIDNAFWDQRVTAAVGLFRSESDLFGDDSGFDFRSAVTGRLTGLVWYDEATQGRDLLHLGLAYSARATRADRVQFRVRPEIRLGAAEPNIPFFADTGPVPARFYQLIGSELFWVRGPLSVQGEYVLVPVSTSDRGAVYFQTWYVMASVFLTGEHLPYRKRFAQLERVDPRREFVRADGGGLLGGPGAWELACRVSHVDLNHGGVTGGRLTDTTFGLNWYLNAYTRLTVNYIRAYLLPPGGRPGAADLFGVRFNFDF